MEAYSGFAQVYDTFMDDVPYEEWGAYLLSVLHGYGIKDGLVVDLGCGTGKMTVYLHEQGYEMIGVDMSEDMLSIAKDRSSDDILYIQQDMCQLELLEKARAMISVCDCLNYILDPNELTEVFQRVHRYLDTQGMFIFDMNSVYKYEELLGEETIAEDREECSFIWDNFYDETEKVNEYCLSVFVKEQGDLFRRYQEIHYQRAYTQTEIKSLLAQAGFKLLAVYDGYTHEAVKEDSERWCFIAQKIA